MFKFILVIISIFFINIIFCQLPNAKDKVILKDSTEYIGYVFEQIPGKEIKLIRIVEKDTVTIKMNQIAKYAKVFDSEKNIIADIKGEDETRERYKLIKRERINYNAFYSFIDLNRNHSRAGFESLIPEIVKELGFGLDRDLNRNLNVGMTLSFLSNNQFSFNKNKIDFRRVDIGGQLRCDLKILPSSKIKIGILFGCSYILESSSYKSDREYHSMTNYVITEISRTYNYYNSIGVKLGAPMFFSLKNRKSLFFIEPSIMYHNPQINLLEVTYSSIEVVSSTVSFKGRQAFLSLKLGIEI